MLFASRYAHPKLSLHLLTGFLLLLLLFPLLPQQLPSPAAIRFSPTQTQQLADQLGRLPLVFEPAAEPALFQARGLGGMLFFSPAAVLLTRAESSHFQVQFVDSDPATSIEAIEPLPGRVSRFLGNDPARWQRDLPTAAALLYRQLYPGVDLRYDGAMEGLKGTYLLAAGADPARIRWRYEGASDVRLGPSGDLQIVLQAHEPRAAQQTLVERAPVAWQEISGARVPVPAAFALAPDGSVGFRLGQYDARLPLTIDPTLVFSTYLGTPDGDFIHDLAFDQQGNIYAIGMTFGSQFPVRDPLWPNPAGESDVVLLKLSPSGTSLLFSTYIGGSGNDEGVRVMVDQQGIAIVGNTKSNDFPTTLATSPVHGASDMFVARLNASGTALGWSRYLGGSKHDMVADAALDAEGRVTLIGTAESQDFPAGAGPVFQSKMPNQGQISPVIAQLTPDGSALTFRTYLAGTAIARGVGLALAPGGDLVVAGWTQGDFPIRNPFRHPSGTYDSSTFQGGASDGFIARLTPGATDLVFSSYLGGRSSDEVRDLTLDSTGAATVAGFTRSDDLPHSASPMEPVEQGGFVSKLSADGQTLVLSFLLADWIERIVTDPLDNLYVLGNSTAPVQPVNPVVPAPPDGQGSALLVKLSSNGQTTQIRSPISGLAPLALAVGPGGRVALGGFAGPGLPLRNALQNKPLGDLNVAVMIIDTAPQLELAGASDPAVLPACASNPCPPVRFTWTLTAPYRLDATLAVTLPADLELVPESLAGATLVNNTLHFSGSVLPETPHTIVYQGRARQGLLPGSLLTTTASATTPGASSVARSLTVALPSEKIGTLVMIYASGDNDLRDAMLMLATHAERGADARGVIGVLLLDGPGADDAYLYKLQPTAPGQPDCFGRLRDFSCGGRYVLGQTVWKWPDSLASADTLTDFLLAVQRAFPADHRVLSLVGHGGGWSPTVMDGQPSRHGGQPSGDMGGMLWDDHPGASLSTATLARALNTSRLVLGRPLDLLFLDACTMGQIEVAYELRDTADYLLVSPNWKWAVFPYDRHLQSAGAGGGREIGLAWLANEQAALEFYLDEPYTYTLLDLGQIEALNVATDALARQLMTLKPDQVKAALWDAERYDGDQDGALLDKDSALDLGSLAEKAAKRFADQPALLDSTEASAVGQVRLALQSVVVKQTARSGVSWLFPNNPWRWEHPAGLSIYLPLGQDDWRRRYYRNLAFGGGNAWADLIDWLWEGNPPDHPPCPEPCGLPPGPLPSPPLRRYYLPLIKS